jgi:hypothetical protein
MSPDKELLIELVCIVVVLFVLVTISDKIKQKRKQS